MESKPLAGQVKVVAVKPAVATAEKPNSKGVPLFLVLLSMRPHVLASLAMFLTVAFMAVEPSRNTRILVIAPFALFFILFVTLLTLEFSELSKTK